MDEEAADYASLPDGERQMYVFPCAWRGEKLCRGICEKMGYKEELHGEALQTARL